MRRSIASPLVPVSAAAVLEVPPLSVPVPSRRPLPGSAVAAVGGGHAHREAEAEATAEKRETGTDWSQSMVKPGSGTGLFLTQMSLI